VSRHEDAEARAAGVDWIGAFLYTSGTLLLLTGLSEGVSQGWKTPFIIALLVLSVIFLVAFVTWQHYLERRGTSDPLMRVSIFSNGRFSVAMIIVCLFSAGFTNWLVYSTYLYALQSRFVVFKAKCVPVTKITNSYHLFRLLCGSSRWEYLEVRVPQSRE
jgi:hypothetical protein